MKIDNFYLFFPLSVAVVLFCIPASSIAQQHCCCCNGVTLASEAIKDKDYKEALRILVIGQNKCPDASRCPELLSLYRTAKQKMGIMDRGKIIIENFFTGKKKAVQKLEKRFKAEKNYTMGDQFGEGDSDEKSHSVTLRRIWISETEVTFDEYDAFCTQEGKGRILPPDNGWGRGRLPVINIDWYDAIEYCNWRSTKEGLTPAYKFSKISDPNNKDSGDTKKWKVDCNFNASGYRLPTEAEWEYKARGNGDKIKYGNNKDTADPAEINYDPRSSNKNSSTILYRQRTVVVDDLAENSLHLKNISGNVSEWCWDWYNEHFYDGSDQNNPTGAKEGSNRVCRGGSWRDNPTKCRLTHRKALQPIYKGNDVGFRLVRTEQ